MSFPRYPSYKDSGVAWLGEVPEHWKVLPIKSIVAVPITDGPHETPQFIDEGIPFVSAEAVSSGRIDFSKVRACISAEDNARYSLKYAPKLHDIYMVKSGATTGITAIVEDRTDFNIWSPLAVIRCGQEAVPYFVLNFMRSRNFLEAVTLNWTFGTQQNIGMGVIENLFCTLPPIAEQTQIATFLDRETAKIDALVAEQQRLMELLKEKRQAVISHAVTKGLNPNAPMKPSGIEWLGDVPAHWNISKVKRVASIRYGIGEPPKYHDEGMPLIRATNVHAGKLFEAGLVFVDPSEIPAQRIVWLAPGDIIVVRSGAYTGDSAIIPSGYGPCIAGFDMVLRCHSANPAFIQFALLSTYLKEGQIDLEKMRAAQPHLNAEELGSCVLALPTSKEQVEIIAFLEVASAKFDTLITQAEHTIELLKERRTALISAAVTGQIDVRHLSGEKAA